MHTGCPSPPSHVPTELLLATQRVHACSPGPPLLQQHRRSCTGQMAKSTLTSHIHLHHVSIVLTKTLQLHALILCKAESQRVKVAERYVSGLQRSPSSCPPPACAGREARTQSGGHQASKHQQALQLGALKNTPAPQ